MPPALICYRTCPSMMVITCQKTQWPGSRHIWCLMPFTHCPPLRLGPCPDGVPSLSEADETQGERKHKSCKVIPSLTSSSSSSLSFLCCSPCIDRVTGYSRPRQGAAKLSAQPLVERRFQLQEEKPAVKTISAFALDLSDSN